MADVTVGRVRLLSKRKKDKKNNNFEFKKKKKKVIECITVWPKVIFAISFSQQIILLDCSKLIHLKKVEN